MQEELINYLETQKEQREMFLACAEETQEKISSLREEISKLEESIKDVDFDGLKAEISKITGFIESLTQKEQSVEKAEPIENESAEIIVEDAPAHTEATKED